MCLVGGEPLAIPGHAKKSAPRLVPVTNPPFGIGSASLVGHGVGQGQASSLVPGAGVGDAVDPDGPADELASADRVAPVDGAAAPLSVGGVAQPVTIATEMTKRNLRMPAIL